MLKGASESLSLLTNSACYSLALVAGLSLSFFCSTTEGSSLFFFSFYYTISFYGALTGAVTSSSAMASSTILNGSGSAFFTCFHTSSSYDACVGGSGFEGSFFS